MDRQWQGPLTAFVLSKTPVSLQLVNGFYRINNIFSFKYIFVKVIPFCFSGEICLSSFPIN